MRGLISLGDRTMSMTRSWTDVTLGIAIGVLVMTVAGGMFTMTERASCYAAQVEASAWTSTNAEPVPAAMIPNCSAWESALKALVASGVGSMAAVLGLAFLRIRPGAAAPSA